MLVSPSFRMLRRRAKVIRVFAGLLTLALTPVVLVLFVVVFLGLGAPDASPMEVFRGTWRAIFRVASIHIAVSQRRKILDHGTRYI
jgi:hypothetical protein